MQPIVNVGAFRALTRAMGPGKRACLWVQGCSLRCDGCGSPQHLDAEPSNLAPVQEICSWITSAKAEHDIEGLSFSGGEPFEQAEAVAQIAAHAKSLGLSTLAWSGHLLERLRSDRGPKNSMELLANLDVLIDGRFVKTLVTSDLPLRGSRNQRIHRLTDRYVDTDFLQTHLECKREGDVLEIIGVTDYEEIKLVLSLLGG